MNRIKFLYSIFAAAVVAAVSLTSCIEDDVTLSAADQPLFSVDTLDVGTIFLDEPSQTHALKAYNRSDKIMRISRIGFAEGSAGNFRINVDGFSGTTFHDVEIRPNDSIYILVSATVPRTAASELLDIEDELQFETNGVTRSVRLKATGLDAIELTDPVISADTRWDANKPRRIYGALTIDPGCTLTLSEGLTIYLHDKAAIDVHGALRSEGTPEHPVIMRGDRSGTVITGITFDLMSRQWAGITFHADASPSELRFTEIRNTEYGLIIDGPASASSDEPLLSLIGCRLRNSRDNALTARHTDLRAISTEFAEAGAGAVSITGGKAEFYNCTFSNYYLFAGITGPLLRIDHCNDATADPEGSALPYARIRIANCVLYGASADVSPGNLDDTDVYLHNCLIRSDGTDDDHFTATLWGVDPLFQTRREDYIFDYRLGVDSPALGASDPAWIPSDFPAADFYGTPRPATPALGAYEQAPPESDDANQPTR